MSTWQRTRPSDPGWYWFYGWRWGRKDGKPPVLHTAQIWATGPRGKGRAVLINGQFAGGVRGQCEEGWWLALPVPELPEVEP